MSSGGADRRLVRSGGVVRLGPGAESDPIERRGHIYSGGVVRLGRGRGQVPPAAPAGV